MNHDLFVEIFVPTRTRLSFHGRLESMGAHERTFDIHVWRDFKNSDGWCGASGMPIVHDGKIIGLGIEVSTNMTNSLTCIPAGRLLADAGFREQLLLDNVEVVKRNLDQQHGSDQAGLAKELLSARHAEVYFKSLQEQIGVIFGSDRLPVSPADIVDMICKCSPEDIQEYFDAIRAALEDVNEKLDGTTSDRAAVERAVAALYFLAACRLVDHEAHADGDLLAWVPSESVPLVCAVIATALFGGHLDIWRADDDAGKIPEYYFEIRAKPGSEHLRESLDRALYVELSRKFPDVMTTDLDAGPLTPKEQSRLRSAIRTIRKVKKSSLTLVIKGLSHASAPEYFVEKHKVPALIENREAGVALLGMDPEDLAAEIEFFMSELGHWPRRGAGHDSRGKAQPPSPAGPPDGDGPSR